MIEQIYKEKCEQGSDINQHLPTLRRYAELSDSVTEMGVREVVSTWAFLAARPKKLTSWDINYHPNMKEALNQAYAEGIDFNICIGDTTKASIPETDFLFIDTLHTYEQLKAELALHGSKVRKFIAFHDTDIFGKLDETGTGLGLMPAILEFIKDNPEWKIAEQFTNNFGLTVLSK